MRSLVPVVSSRIFKKLRIDSLAFELSRAYIGKNQKGIIWA
jgi:hypothetical protein